MFENGKLSGPAGSRVSMQVGLDWAPAGARHTVFVAPDQGRLPLDSVLCRTNLCNVSRCFELSGFCLAAYTEASSSCWWQRSGILGPNTPAVRRPTRGQAGAVAELEVAALVQVSPDNGQPELGTRRRWGHYRSLACALVTLAC